MRAREQRRLAARQRANARLCGLSLIQYLALTYPVRKARVRAAKKGAHRV